jgi:hypothetical protein
MKDKHLRELNKMSAATLLGSKILILSSLRGFKTRTPETVAREDGRSGS